MERTDVHANFFSEILNIYKMHFPTGFICSLVQRSILRCLFNYVRVIFGVILPKSSQIGKKDTGNDTRSILLK